MKQYTEKNSVGKNYMFEVEIDIPANCTQVQGIILKKIILITIKSNRGNVSINNHYSLVSFDVRALFTSIPINRAILCFKEFLNCQQEIYDKTRSNSLEILKLV